jgi:hypothetical protein
VICLWIQEEPHEGHNSSKRARAELLEQVGDLYLYFLHNDDFNNLFNSWNVHLWVKPQREEIKQNK